MAHFATSLPRVILEDGGGAVGADGVYAAIALGFGIVEFACTEDAPVYGFEHEDGVVGRCGKPLVARGVGCVIRRGFDALHCIVLVIEARACEDDLAVPGFEREVILSVSRLPQIPFGSHRPLHLVGHSATSGYQYPLYV